MSRLTSYGAHNFQLDQDYQFRCTQTQIGQPTVVVSCDLSSGKPANITVGQWYKYVQIEEAAFSYVGMDYATALSCAVDMRSRLTNNYYQPWVYGNYADGTTRGYGWYKLTYQYLPQLESTVDVMKNGNGDMYDVRVNAKITTEDYKLNSSAGYNSKPLKSILNGINGWSADIGAWDNGHAIVSAGDNIQLVTAPSYVDDWKLIAQQVRFLNGEAESISGLSIDTWYEVTTKYTAAVKYEGMTLSACRSLYNKLNTYGNTGWILSSHPYVPVALKISGDWNLYWVHDTSRTDYQCLNKAMMQHTGGKMWTIELQLEAQQISIMKNGNTVQHSWPSVWYNIPSMSIFL